MARVKIVNRQREAEGKPPVEFERELWVSPKRLLRLNPSSLPHRSKKLLVFLPKQQWQVNVMNYVAWKENVIVGRLIPAGYRFCVSSKSSQTSFS